MELTNQLQQMIPLAEQRIRPIVRETPVDFSNHLSHLTGCKTWLKLEHLQQTGSFKLRGASNKIFSRTSYQRRFGVVAASTGNHGLGVCFAAARAGVSARIYLPHNVPENKVEMIRALGGEVLVHGNECLDAELKAREDARSSGRIFISPYNDIDVIAGQGTIGIELLRQIENLDAVFVAVGGGGLVSGVAAGLKAIKPEIRVVGCWPWNSRVLLESLRAGRIIEFPEQPTISESTAGSVEPGSVTFDLCRELIDEAVVVSEEEIMAAMGLIADHERWIVEGSAGLAVAGLLKTAERYRSKNVAVLLCGRNIAWPKFREVTGSWKSATNFTNFHESEMMQ